MLRSMDAFVKPRDDLQTRSAVGGAITLVAAGAAFFLFLAQMHLYVFGSTRHSLHLSESSPIAILPNMNRKQPLQARGRIPMKVHVTFPHVSCEDLDLAHDNAYFSTGDFQIEHGPTALTLRRPTRNELNIATRGTTKDLKRACTVQGAFDISQVGGTFAVTVSNKAWRQATGRLMFGSRGFQPNDQVKLFNVRYEPAELLLWYAVTLIL